MASSTSPGSNRKTTPTMQSLRQFETNDKTPTNDLASCRYLKPLSSSNQSVPSGHIQGPSGDETVSSYPENKKIDSTGIEDVLARLRLNDSRKPSLKMSCPTKGCQESNALDKILTELNGKTKVLKKQEQDLKDESESDAPKEEDHSSSSDLLTPATDSFDVVSGDSSRESERIRIDAAEILKVKQELAAAKAKIAQQDQELAETRNIKHTMDQTMGPPSEADFGSHSDISEQTMGNIQSAFNASARPFTSRTDNWTQHGGSRPSSSSFPAGIRGRAAWGNQTPTILTDNFGTGVGPIVMYENAVEEQVGSRQFNVTYGDQMSPMDTAFTAPFRTFSGSSGTSLGLDGRMLMDPTQQPQPIGMRRGQSNMRSSSTFSERAGPYPAYANGNTATSPPNFSPVNLPQVYGYQPRPIGPPLSPTGSEYSVSAMQALPSWPNAQNGNGQTYVTPMEPMNYRRLLDKSVSCDWKYIVDKIVCNNDQQASIFLQQKLKVGTAEQKFEIVEAIVNQAYPLMINRFGNFLVQRCFEHGTPEQVVAIANAIHGNVLSLSMDPFGCHVIQKAFDSVPENHKADMVRELLRRIPDTVIHRYACHVWQKLFELRWSGEPPQIMLKVNEALRGMWHEVALGETGSLVVQNIFENCTEEEKRPAIEEVIANIDLIAHGQFGNWCIQHLCEHSSPPDKKRVIDHILANAYSYSIDQFASKVVEKCLKIGGGEFLERYLSVVTTPLPDRPRIPLIDIAGDQYGNYLIQWILMNTHHHQREQVANHIRKHMVSLRGSKFGSRVAMLCCNPASVTRPGPGVIVNPYGAPGQPRGWSRFR